MIKALAADELAVRQRHHKLTWRAATATRLDRSCAALQRKLTIDQLDEPQMPRQLAADRQPRVRRQRLIVGAHHYLVRRLWQR